MVLDAPLGNDRGYFGARIIDDTLIGLQNVWSYGYPVDLDPTVSTPYAQGQRTIRPFGITANADCGKYGPLVTDGKSKFLFNRRMINQCGRSSKEIN